MAATTQNQYASMNTTRLAKQESYARNLKDARINHDKKKQRKKEQKKYTQNLVNDASGNVNVGNNKKNTPQTDAQKIQNMRKIQQIARENINDTELHNIADNVVDTFSSSKAMLPIKISKLAYDSRAALTDYTSKWWIVAFTLALAKDSVLDIFILPGYALSIYFFIFLFGGGFVRKYLKKKIAIFIILFIVGFIPVVGFIVPETTLMVFLRWNGSKKAAEKGKNNLKRIEKKYSKYDTRQ